MQDNPTTHVVVISINNGKQLPLFANNKQGSIGICTGQKALPRKDLSSQGCRVPRPSSVCVCVCTCVCCVYMYECMQYVSVCASFMCVRMCMDKESVS